MEQPAVHRDPDILGGTPVFARTRVPAKNLFDYLEAGTRWIGSCIRFHR